MQLNYILFDDQYCDRLKPFTFLRPAAEIRCGILTIREKWEQALGSGFSHLTRDYLSKKFPINLQDVNFYINGRFFPEGHLLELIKKLEPGQAITWKENILAFSLSGEKLTEFNKIQDSVAGLDKHEVKGDFTCLSYPWSIFQLADKSIRADFDVLTKGKTSQKVSDTNTLISPENIFIEEGARLECAVLNATEGPIYIGKNAEAGEGAMVRGPLALCEGAALKMGAKVYGPSVIGPHSKVGGEVSNVVILGYSNKGHDGFLGNSVIGEWCNLGADTNSSNLKNNYSTVKIFDYSTGEKTDSGLQFCGLLMGDHSKCGINTMFNTGTVTGIFCNIFDNGFPPVHIPSFAWGGASGFLEYIPEKAYETAEKMMARRSIKLTKTDTDLMTAVYDETRKDRKF